MEHKNRELRKRRKAKKDEEEAISLSVGLLKRICLLHRYIAWVAECWIEKWSWCEDD